MADVYSPDDGPARSGSAAAGEPRVGMPRWVKIFIVVAAVFSVAFVATFGI
jgi:hypothetical protein